MQDAGVALGVIVLAGNSDKDEGLRRFAAQLVDRPGPKVLVWTAGDVRALAERALTGMPPASVTRETRSSDEVAIIAPSASAPLTTSGLASATSHAGKYLPLYRWLRAQERTSISMTFAELERVLGFALPEFCRNHVPHWHSCEGSAVARAIIDAGWKASRVNLGGQTVVLVPVDH